MLSLERREFIVLSVGALVARRWRHAAPSVHLTLDGGSRDARRGAEMSADEVQRAAAMFGGRADYTAAGTEGAPGRLHVSFGSGGDALVMSLGRANECRRDTFEIGPPAGFVAWHSSLTRFGADTLNKRYRARFNAPMTSDAWCGWFAVKCGWEAALRSNATSIGALRDFLEKPTTRFDGHKGVPLSFDAAHELRQPLYDVHGSEVSSAITERTCVSWK